MCIYVFLYLLQKCHSKLSTTKMVSHPEENTPANDSRCSLTDPKDFTSVPGTFKINILQWSSHAYLRLGCVGVKAILRVCVNKNLYDLLISFYTHVRTTYFRVQNNHCMNRDWHDFSFVVI